MVSPRAVCECLCGVLCLQCTYADMTKEGKLKHIHLSSSCPASRVYSSDWCGGLGSIVKGKTPTRQSFNEYH